MSNALKPKLNDAIIINDVSDSSYSHDRKGANQNKSSKPNASNRYQLLTNIQVNQNLLIALVSLYIVVTANFQFFSQILTVYSFAQNVGFILSLSGLLFALIWLVIQLISYRVIVKAVLILMLMVSAISSYFSDTYGTIFDTNMLINTLQTDSAEASDLLSPAFIARVIIFGVIPSLFVAKLKLVRLPWKKGIAQKVVGLLLSVVLMVTCLLPFSDQYADFFREHKSLRYYSIPVIPIYSSIKLGTDFIADLRRPDGLIEHASDAKKLTLPATANAKPKLMVFVVGETARADHIGLNGYARQTTPLLAQQNDVYSFKQVTSCGTSTAYSVPCMFSYAGQKNYDVDTAQYHENVLDTLSKQGVKVIWRDNNSSSKGVADRVSYSDFKTKDSNPVCDIECRDIGMLDGFSDLITPSQDTLIVLHQMGNHGPAYNKRYPASFEKYRPVCDNSDLSKCDSQSIINGYDNAIVYSDYFLNEIINTLKTYENEYDVVMLYVSDHGESLGENNIYLHGLPYSIAPQQQKQVPAIIWSPASNSIDNTSITHLLNTPVSHDYITPSLLNFFAITTQEVQSKPTFFQTRQSSEKIDAKSAI